MSEPYDPMYLDSLGIEYIKEESKDFGKIYNNDFNDIANKRNNLMKRKAMLQVLEYHIKKRELEKSSKVKKRLFV